MKNTGYTPSLCGVGFVWVLQRRNPGNSGLASIAPAVQLHPWYKEKQ